MQDERNDRAQRDYTKPQTGDLVACLGGEPVSAAISLGQLGIPCWPFYSPSHVGIVVEYDGRPFVAHSTSDRGECQITGSKQVCGVQAQSVEWFIANYRGRVWHYPLYRKLYGPKPGRVVDVDNELDRLTESILADLGKPYDRIGAVRAGGGLLAQFVKRAWRTEDLHWLFCAEFVALKHTQAGLIQDDNASLWSPRSLVNYERFRRIIRAANGWK